jgi:putative FmdB family regulatory protein
MALYEFSCMNCKTIFEELSPCDNTGEYPDVVCPNCGSVDKKKMPSMFAFNFSDPEGTKRWNSDSAGHDYRFKTKSPQVQAERAFAEASSHMGSNPYNDKNDMDRYDAGIHDA